MFHSTIYGNRIYTPRSSRASHIHRLSERFPFVAASPFKANGEAIRSLGACSRDLDGGRGPRRSVQIAGGHAAAFRDRAKKYSAARGPHGCARL